MGPRRVKNQAVFARVEYFGKMEANRAVRGMISATMENYIFHISPMYEFLHSLGQKRTAAPYTGK
jgi:hypothetical protein